MQRDPALILLSRDHHQALFAAQRLKRAGSDEDARETARTGFLEFWHGHGNTHFEIEEQVLLPAYAEHADPHGELVARALCEHVALRRDAAIVDGDPQVPAEHLIALGTALAAHVRFEERSLFPAIEAALPPDALAALAARVEAAEHAAGQHLG